MKPRAGKFGWRALVLAILLATAAAAAAQAAPRLSSTDRVRLAEAFRLGKAFGDQLWPGWNRAPFAVLLVASEYEFLIRTHDRPRISNGSITTACYAAMSIIASARNPRISWRRFHSSAASRQSLLAARKAPLRKRPLPGW